MEKISVIVPIYNCEKYLERCINSIIKQNYENIEIILVNDGSVDKSQEICERYKKNNDNIILINKKNGGLSDARNVGLNNSTGSLISFIDADDFIDENMYKNLYNIIIEEKSDMVVSSYFKYKEKNDVELFGKMNLSMDYEKNSKKFLIKNFIGNNFDNWNKEVQLASVCRCLYKKEILENIRFENIKNVEDRLFNLEVLCRLKKVSITNEAYYYYYYNINSITTNYSDDMFLNLLKSKNKTDKILNKLEFFDEIKYEYFATLYLQLKMLILNEAHPKNNNNYLISMKRITKFYKEVKNIYKLKLTDIKKMNKIDRYIYILIKCNLSILVLYIYKKRRLNL